jgi:ankyrin repeat protein
MSDFESWLPEIRSNPQHWLPAIIRSGDASLVLELIQNHPHLLEARFTGNATPLLLAAYSGNDQIASALLDKGAKVDFIAAIALQRLGLVRAMLAENPLLIRKHSSDGWMALHVAVRYATTELVALLISAGGDVNGRGKGGITPLFFALREPFDNARLLLAHGANINTAGKHGFTPLHCAAASGDSGAVRFLVAHGATVNFQTDARQTAWSLAVRYGHANVAALLES